LGQGSLTFGNSIFPIASMPGHPSAASRWAPIIVWMSVIFLASTDLGSAAHTGSIVMGLLRWLSAGRLSLPAMEEIHHLIRKSAHLTEYAVLGCLLWRAFAGAAAPSRAGAAATALLAAALYACTDEYHQSFVPSRTSSIYDVMIDTAGAAIGIAICLAAASKRPRRSEAPRPPLRDRA
jgi:VanZ family protein